MSNLICGKAAVGGNDNLTHDNTSKVTDMNSLFANCNKLPSVDLSGFNTSKVTDMNSMFKGCNSLTSLDISEFNTSKVTDMNSMFRLCSSLTSLELSGFDTSNVTDMYNIFCNCSGLTSLDVSGFNTSKVTNMSQMFVGCSGLKKLDISKLDTSNAEKMYAMFAECTNLIDLNLDGIDTSNVKDMWYMFGKCSNLKTLDVSGFDTSSAEHLGSMFYECTSLENLDVSGFDTSNASAIGSMFYNCSKLTNIEVDNFNTSNATSLSYMFAGCSSLTHINVSGFDTSKATMMREMFENCSNLTAVDVSHFNTAQVKDMSGMFANCTGLTSLNLFNFDTSEVRDMNSMFEGCVNLKCLNLESFDTSKTTYREDHGTGYTLYHGMDNMLKSCTSLSSLKTPSTMGVLEADLPHTMYAEDNSEYNNLSTDNTGMVLSNMKRTDAFKIIFDSNASDVIPENMLEQYIKAGEKETLTANLFKRNGYSFKCWNSKSDGTGIEYSDMADITAGSGGDTLTLYAQWKEPDYSITYILNGGENNALNPIIYDASTETITLAAPTKLGFSFDGWYSDNKFTNKVTEIPNGSTGNKRLYAKWIANKYSIHFDGNGSTEGNMSDMSDCCCGQNYILTENTFKKSYHDFTGWNTKTDGSGTSYSDKASVNNLSIENNATVTLYAQWKITQYAITYNLDGSTNASINPSTYNYSTETITLAAPTKPGFTFNGWYSDATFTTKVIEIAKGSTGDKILYAKWTGNKYSITFDGNDSTEGAMETMKDLACGEKHTLPENTFKRTAYTFSGWNTEADGSGTSYADKAEVQDLSTENGATVKLYAQWTAIKYTITYNLDGGTNATSNPTSYDIETETIALSAPAKKDMVFDGWYSDAACTINVTEIVKGSSGDKIFYAKWKKPGRYAIAYQLSGGTNAASNPDRYDETTTPVTLSDPTREGYDFGGWYSDSSFKNKVTELKTTDKGNLILRAKWTAHKYTITFNKGGDGVTGKTPAMKNRVYDTTYELTANKFQRKGFVFLGWGLDENGTDVTFRNQDNVKNLTAEKGGSVTLYARWFELAENKAYSITYRLNGGVNDPGNPAYYIEGTSVTFKDPIKTGYKFDGWYANSNLKKGKTEKIDTDGKGNKTLYAKWTPLTYTIKFNSNPNGITAGNSDATSGTGGKVENTMSDTANVKIGKKITLKANKFIYEGYTFAGWNTAPDGSGTFYKNKASAKDISLLADGTFSDTVTLYAQWTETKYAITYKVNKGKLPKDSDLTEGTSCPKSYTISSDTITLAEPTRKNYTFAGWYTTKKFKDGTKIETIPTGSTKKLTLYAKWAKNGK